MAAAAADALLDVAYRIVDSPLGPLLVAATERGLVRLAYQREDHDAVLHTLAEQVSPRLLHAPRRLDEAARQLGTTLPASGGSSVCRWISACRAASAVRSSIIW